MVKTNGFYKRMNNWGRVPKNVDPIEVASTDAIVVLVTDVTLCVKRSKYPIEECQENALSFTFTSVHTERANPVKFTDRKIVKLGVYSEYIEKPRNGGMRRKVHTKRVHTIAGYCIYINHTIHTFTPSSYACYHYHRDNAARDECCYTLSNVCGV